MLGIRKNNVISAVIEYKDKEVRKYEVQNKYQGNFLSTSDSAKSIGGRQFFYL